MQTGQNSQRYATFREMLPVTLRYLRSKGRRVFGPFTPPESAGLYVMVDNALIRYCDADTQDSPFHPGPITLAEDVSWFRDSQRSIRAAATREPKPIPLVNE